MNEINQLVFTFAGLYSIKKHYAAAHNIIDNSILAMFICFIIGLPVVIYDIFILIKINITKRNENIDQNNITYSEDGDEDGVIIY